MGFGKIKYLQARSALVMKNSGKRSIKCYLSNEGIKVGFGIPIPIPLAYGALMQNIGKLYIGEIISLDTICSDLPSEQHVDGVYRDLGNFCHFYFETDSFRKEGEKLL